MEENIPNRVTRLETQMAEVRSDVSEIKQRLGTTATKEDVTELRRFLETRDQLHGDKLWWITKTLLLLFGGAVAVAFGIQQLPKIK